MRIECPKFKKPDGTECYVIILVNGNYTHKVNDVFRFKDVMYRNLPKRKWISLQYKISSDLQYRGYSYDEKYQIKSLRMNEFIGEQALKDAMNYAWQYIKPSILKEDNHNG